MNNKSISAISHYQLIQCQVGQGIYGLDTSQIARVERVDRSSLSETDKNSEISYAKIDDFEIPIVDLGLRLGETLDHEYEDRRLIILNGATGLWGLMVDQVSQALTIPADQIYPLHGFLLANDSTDFTFGHVAKINDDMLLILSLDLINPNRPEVEKKGIKESTERVLSQFEPEHSLDLGENALSFGQIVVFTFPNLKENIFFALSISQISEILESLPILPIPNASPSVLGLVEWRNRPVPILDLQRHLGLQVDNGDYNYNRLIIIRLRNPDQSIEYLGVMVHSELQILSLPVSCTTYNGPKLLDPIFTKIIVNMDNRILIVPDLYNMIKAVKA